MPLVRPRRLVAGSLAAAVVGAGSLFASPAQAAPPSTPFISELHYDNAGADVGEFVEVQLPPGTSSAGLSVVLYNGSGGASYATLSLPAVTAPADASAVVTVSGPGAGIQNGSPDGLALVSGTTVLEFLSYEGTFTATGGPAAGQTATDIGVAEPETSPSEQSLSRFYDSAADRLSWQGPATNTRGTVNGSATVPSPSLSPSPTLTSNPSASPAPSPTPSSTVSPPPTPTPGPAACDTPAVQIGDVQGPGAATPSLGQTVTVRGVVVGDLPGLRGFSLQDAGDQDPATSDGIFVFSPLAVDLGDSVAVTGAVQEFSGQTQLSPAAGGAELCDEGDAADLPVGTELDLPADDAARERLEGMLVSPADTLTVSEVFDLTSFGELTLSEGGLLVTPTEVARPATAEAAAVAASNELRRIVLDDGLSARVTTATRPYLSSDSPVRVGDRVTFTAPTVLGYGFGQWRLQPADGTAAGTFAPTNTRTAAPEPVGGDLQVGAFNVLNYFLTLTGPDARGARTPVQFERQAGKIVPAIEALDAEVVTLMEIEDTASTGYSPGDPDRALADLVRRLNASAGIDTWAYVPLPKELLAVDRDVIRNGIIYQRDRVQPVGGPVGLVEESVWFNAREPIAQTFSADGDRFTVVANHFKSKSPGKPSGDNVDDGDGQGEWNGDRIRQAASLAEFARQLRTSTGDEDVLLMGDFNAYTQEDPIERLREAGFTDLGEQFDPGRYSYVFNDASGSLDHALATSALTAKVTDVTHWNINAVESFAYQYTGDPALYAADPYRSSDHDPLVLGIDLEERCQGQRPTLRGTASGETLRGTAGRDVIMGLGGNDTIDGGNADDLICGGTGDDRLAGANGVDTLLGGFGSDTLSGGTGDDRLVGGPGTDVLSQDLGSGTTQQDGPES